MTAIVENLDNQLKRRFSPADLARIQAATAVAHETWANYTTDKGLAEATERGGHVVPRHIEARLGNIADSEMVLPPSQS